LLPLPFALLSFAFYVRELSESDTHAPYIQHTKMNKKNNGRKIYKKSTPPLTKQQQQFVQQATTQQLCQRPKHPALWKYGIFSVRLLARIKII